MQLSDWFTIIAILLAVLAFFSQAERKILLLKRKGWQIKITTFILFLFIPFLLYYEKLATTFPWLNAPPFSYQTNLPKPSDWAFVLVFLSISYWIWWFLFRIKKVKPTEGLINHYLRSINTMPFEDLFRLFIKYEETQFHPKFN